MFDAEIIGRTKPHGRAPIGNAVECWRWRGSVAYTIHGGDSETARMALIFWWDHDRQRWALAALERSLENSYHCVPLKEPQRGIQMAFEAAMEVLSRWTLNFILTP